MENHDHKLTVRRTMRAFDVVLHDSRPNRLGKPWTVLSQEEAHSLALELLFLTDRDGWRKVVERDPAIVKQSMLTSQ